MLILRSITICCTRRNSFCRLFCFVFCHYSLQSSKAQITIHQVQCNTKVNTDSNFFHFFWYLFIYSFIYFIIAVFENSIKERSELLWFLPHLHVNDVTINSGDILDRNDVQPIAGIWSLIFCWDHPRFELVFGAETRVLHVQETFPILTFMRSNDFKLVWRSLAQFDTNSNLDQWERLIPMKPKWGGNFFCFQIPEGFMARTESITGYHLCLGSVCSSIVGNALENLHCKYSNNHMTRAK